MDNGDYISRKSLIENLNRFAPEAYTRAVDLIINKEPTVDVEKVTKCKECKYCDYKPSVIGCACFKDGLLRNTRENDFCSYGERRTENA